MPRHLPQDSWQRVGETIRTIREIRGLTADKLSLSLGISRPYLANIEGGRKPLPSKLLPLIAAALHVPQIAILNCEDPATVIRKHPIAEQVPA